MSLNIDSLEDYEDIIVNMLKKKAYEIINILQDMITDNLC